MRVHAQVTEIEQRMNTMPGGLRQALAEEPIRVQLPDEWRQEWTRDSQQLLHDMMRESMANVQSTLAAEFQTRIDNLEHTVADQGMQISQLQAQLECAHAKIELLETANTVVQVRQNDTAANLEADVKDVHTRVNAIEARMASLDNAIKQNQAAVVRSTVSGAQTGSGGLITRTGPGTISTTTGLMTKHPLAFVALM